MTDEDGFASQLSLADVVTADMDEREVKDKPEQAGLSW